MDFGRLPSLTGIEFRLPADAPATARVLARAPNGILPIDSAGVRIGAPTFAHKELVGSYYPFGTKDADYLRQYARQWPALELNSTHYGLPGPATVARWRAATLPGFQFCPKLPQRITHDLALSAVADPDVAAFGQWLAALGAERVGLPFAQLPPTFGPDSLPALQRFLLLYKEVVGGALAVELRHPLWFSSPLAREEVFNLFEALEVTAVISDVAGRRDVLHQRLTTTTAFLRLNAHALDPTDYARADAWAERLADWLRAGLRTAYVFIHQRDPRHTPVLARYLAEQVAARTSHAVAAPRPVTGPVQGSLF
ncbi:MAG: DUF72 domain-containing protein [Hymenobacteraceae bacterium]|nr:DUF72 domain-containing protein [Hymenobacteraceae bacterium]